MRSEPHHRLPLALLGLLAASCAAPLGQLRPRSPLLEPGGGPLTSEPAPPASLGSGRGPGAALPAGLSGERAAATARAMIGRSGIEVHGQRYPDDCSGLVRAVWATQGVDLMAEGEPGDNGVTAIWRFCRRHGEVHREAARPGDLVFFRDTYDRNRDGRRDDGLTHIGVVERAGPEGEVEFIHHASHGVVRYRMNPSRPHEHAGADGRVVNDFLREDGPERLSGELFVGYATLAR